ncbi:unnamed protein product [Effrenium voratum]|nr:unnamed protein product [Effrenium voratum]
MRRRKREKWRARTAEYRSQQVGRATNISLTRTRRPILATASAESGFAAVWFGSFEDLAMALNREVSCPDYAAKQNPGEEAQMMGRQLTWLPAGSLSFEF